MPLFRLLFLPFLIPAVWFISRMILLSGVRIFLALLSLLFLSMRLFLPFWYVIRLILLKMDFFLLLLLSVSGWWRGPSRFWRGLFMIIDYLYFFAAFISILGSCWILLK